MAARFLGRHLEGLVFQENLITKPRVHSSMCDCYELDCEELEQWELAIEIAPLIIPMSRKK